MNEDTLIDAARIHFAASKRPDYRQRVEKRFIALHRFLVGHNLLHEPLLSENETITDSFELWKSDLTDEGYALISAGYMKWLRGIDRGKNVEDVTILQKTLDNIRGQSTK